MGAVVNLDADATDGDNDTLTYSATGLPAGVTIAPATGVISGTLAVGSAGTYNVTVSVTDGTASASPADTFTWTVNSADPPPGRSGGRRRGPGERRRRALVDGQRRARPRGLPRVPRDHDAGAHRRATGSPARALLTSPSYTDTTAVNGTTYNYVVVAVDTANQASAASATVSATPSAKPASALQLNGIEPVRDLRCGAGAGLADLHAGAVVPAHRRGRRRRPPAADGIASAIPLVTKGRAEREPERRHELLLRHRRHQRRARGRLRGHRAAPSTTR